MACVNKIRSWTTAILHLFSQETDLLIKVIMKCVNIKLWDILDCFHYKLNAPRKVVKVVPEYSNWPKMHVIHKNILFHTDIYVYKSY